MGAEAQVNADRLHAQESTGPRTAEGRAAVALNAVKHGLRARAVVLPGEGRMSTSGSMRRCWRCGRNRAVYRATSPVGKACYLARGTRGLDFSRKNGLFNGRTARYLARGTWRCGLAPPKMRFLGRGPGCLVACWW
jgi:hypothetical protein